MNRIIEPSAGGLPVVEPQGGHPEVRWLTVDAETVGQRLDNFLLRQLKGVPKTHVYRLIRSGQVRVNKGRAQADTRLAEGDVVRVPPVRLAQQPGPDTASMAPAREFVVLHEDEGLIAIDKPAGVAVHGGSGVSSGVIEQLRRARGWGEPGGARYLELVHRLDRDTSGLLLIAKKRSTLKALQEQFRQRQIDKTYLALVRGDWPETLRRIDQPLQRYLLPDGERRVRPVAVHVEGAQQAITVVRVRARQDGFSLLEVGIKTGRTHQIRVHLASQGHPIAGDDKYGDFALNRSLPQRGLRRMFLHAWRLRFEHPADGRRIELHAELPSDLPFPLLLAP